MRRKGHRNVPGCIGVFVSNAEAAKTMLMQNRAEQLIVMPLKFVRRLH